MTTGFVPGVIELPRGGFIINPKTTQHSLLVPINNDILDWNNSIIFSAVISESASKKSSITSKPIETGVTITDHAFPQPEVINISGQITGNDAKQKLDRLRQLWKESKLLRYIGRTILSEVIIESFTDSYDNKISNGFKFDITLKQVFLVDPPEFDMYGDRQAWYPPEVPIPPVMKVVPEPAFEADITQGDVPLRVTFTDKTWWGDLADSCGDKLLRWDIGGDDFIHSHDAEFTKDISRTHIFMKPGVYSPKLSVKNAFVFDEEGISITMENYITVTGEPISTITDPSWNDVLKEAIVGVCHFEPDPRRDANMGRDNVSNLDGWDWQNGQELIDGQIFGAIHRTEGTDLLGVGAASYYGARPEMGLQFLHPPYMLHFSGFVFGEGYTMVHSRSGVVQRGYAVSGERFPMVYGTPWRSSAFPQSRYAFVLLDVADNETEITRENFNQSVKLYRIDTRMLLEDTVI